MDFNEQYEKKAWTEADGKRYRDLTGGILRHRTGTLYMLIHLKLKFILFRRGQIKALLRVITHRVAPS